MKDNDKINLQFKELELLAEKHKMLISKDKLQTFGIIMMVITMLCGVGLLGIALWQESWAILFASMTIIVLCILQTNSIGDKKVDIEDEIEDLEYEIDKKIDTVVKDLAEEFENVTINIIKNLKNNAENAKHNEQKCSKNGKNTKNNAKKAENKTKTTKK